PLFFGGTRLKSSTLHILALCVCVCVCVCVCCVIVTRACFLSEGGIENSTEPF
ncbi:mCG1028082, partial [Mus musculus]